ncbi:Zinc ribbon domain protein [Botrimarina colliarenosi]|uniref:Zinc ribbon domain protein n=1 Tax=Botrimarina colliarenosi TaxID=2528001 RepID=A0A5C6AKY4_9BACT|nr:zinc ribbon domain-containing protein [Botrimarina colliarenosi]TWT99918.1 Zinc ribbon domain protein [Botrimarina colliarenosi]
MPLYEYLCKSCDHEVEVLVRSPEERPACPDCGRTELVKLLSVCATPSGSGRPEAGPPAGSCGSGCGCFPAG